LDIYKRFFNKDAEDKKVVKTGRWVVLGAFGIALVIAPALKSFVKTFPKAVESNRAASAMKLGPLICL